MYRQGDVLLIQVKHIPWPSTRQAHCVVAEGEATGHKHEIVEGAFLVVGYEGATYVEVYEEAATLVHEEHGPITLPGPALYKVIHQREYTPHKIGVYRPDSDGRVSHRPVSD